MRDLHMVAFGLLVLSDLVYADLEKKTICYQYESGHASLLLKEKRTEIYAVGKKYLSCG